MASGPRNNTSPKGKKEETATYMRAQLMKQARAYWKTLQKKWGAKNVGLNFEMKEKGRAAHYSEGRNKGGKGASVTLFLPKLKGYGKATNAPTLTATKRILDHELAHHRQRLKENVDRNPDTKNKTQDDKWHGKAHQKQSQQIGIGGVRNKDFTMKINRVREGPPKPKKKKGRSYRTADATLRAKKKPRLGPLRTMMQRKNKRTLTPQQQMRNALRRNSGSRA